MIGIVVVSHSRALGEAVAGLAREMAGGAESPRLAVAAGLDETTFGTDAAAVAAAIEEVASDDGVLVLVDIGSSVLSAELGCEFLDPEVAERVRISAAPLVEGIVPAVVAAAGGAGLAEVAAEAEEGLAAKEAHLDTPLPPLRSPRGYSTGDVVDIVVNDPHGLHARPAAALAALVRSYDAQVAVANPDAGTGPVPGTSLSKLATLGAAHGARLRVSAEGPQATEVLAAVQALAAQDFAPQRPEPGPSISPNTGGGPSAIPSLGSGLDVAMGPAYVVRDEVDLVQYQPGSIGEEQGRSRAALDAVATALRRRRDALAGADAGAAGEGAGILEAHLALLDDDAIREDVDRRISGGEPAPAVWRDVLHRVAEDFEVLEDAYQRARAQDVRAIERQMLRALVQGAESVLATGDSALPTDAVLVVDELDPATAAGLDPAVAGIVTVRGGDTGHGVIVARSRGIPVFTDGGEPAGAIQDGDTVGFDVPARRLIVRPTPDEEAQLQQLREHRRDAATEARHRAAEPAVTADGVRVRVAANITGVQDAAGAAAAGADGSGLVRTELLFGEKLTVPAVSEQAAAFTQLGRGLRGQPITVRTWDVGGDKPLPFLPGPREANPMLGVRGLRLMRKLPEIFDEQLRAICVAAQRTQVRVMFPMVTTRDEVDWALDHLQSARAEVGAGPIPVGIMVEVPAAALRIAELARGLDFVSIGTNDLTQYTLAADRGNTGVAAITDGLDPAVLQLVRHVADHVPDGVEVAVCGDLASRPEAVPLLLGLGAQELSVVGPVVPQVKQAVRHTSMANARMLADRALAASSATAVRELLVHAR